MMGQGQMVLPRAFSLGGIGHQLIAQTGNSKCDGNGMRKLGDI